MFTAAGRSRRGGGLLLRLRRTIGLISAEMSATADVIVIGAGIAGVSAAAELAASARVIVLEREPQPGYHATGRSAAFFARGYGNAAARAFTLRSESFYRSPPPGFTDAPLFRPRPAIFFGRPDQEESLAAKRDEMPSLQKLSAPAVRARSPVLSPDYLGGGLLDESGGDLDVDAILQGFLRRLRERGGILRVRQEVRALSFSAGVWKVTAGDETLSAPVVVNAGGAWVDEIAALAGLAPLGLQPKRRTAMLIDAPVGMDIAAWPLMVDVDERFYFKPDAGSLLLSPADETPSPPCDAQPEELDVALAVERFEAATGLAVPRVTHRWAGLRTFAPDRVFVVGYDPRVEGFFWLAGQGGYGVQTAPGLSRLAAALLLRSPLPEPAEEDLAAQLSPQRLVSPSLLAHPS